MLSGIDLDSGIRFLPRRLFCGCSLCLIVVYLLPFLTNWYHTFFVARMLDEVYKLSKCVQIARLYLEVV